MVVPKLAESTADVCAETGSVGIVNVAVVAPAGTTTAVGGIALGLPELSEIVTPPAGAALEIATVPVEALPPHTLDGLIEKPMKFGEVMVKGRVLV